MSGSELVSALSNGEDLARHALAVEAGRIVQRLDELDSIIQGKGVLELMQFRLNESFEDDGDERTLNVSVKFDSVLGEARQQANVLRQVLVSLGLGSAEPAEKVERSSVLDELAKLRAARHARASG